MAQHKLDEAMKFLQKARQLNPDNWMIHYNLGSAYLQKKDYDEAAKSYLESFALKRSISVLWWLLILFGTRYRIVVAVLLSLVTLGAFYARSATLLLIPSTLLIVGGIIGIVNKDLKGLLLIVLGSIPLLLFILIR